MSKEEQISIVMDFEIKRAARGRGNMWHLLRLRNGERDALTF